MIASYLIDPTRSAHSLEDTALEHLGYKAVTEESLTGKGAKATATWRTCRPTRVRDFAARARRPAAAAGATDLPARLEPEHLTRGVGDARAAADPGAGRHRAGRRPGGRARCWRRSRRTSSTSWTRSAGRSSIWRASSSTSTRRRQLGEVLFEKLELPSLEAHRQDARGLDRRVEVLEELAATHELPRLVLDWRGLQKLKGTYIDALPQLVNPQTGRVHTSFNQAVAATGRLSSSDPNLQNIPIRTELGREIRRAFVAEPGYVLISADYSQIELRVLAHLSGDETLIAAFQRGDDIHDQTALKVFGADSGLSAHELRRRAKIVNYALLYGKTAFTLAKDIGVTQQAAQDFIEAYFAGFPRVRAFIDQHARRGARHRRRQDDVRPPAAGAGDHQPQRPGARRGRADDRQHADSGHGRRHPEAGDDRARRRARRAGTPASRRRSRG